jgi:homocitrate synthase NifV
MQIYNNLKKDKSWIENNLRECVYFAKNKGYEVTIGFEDASRSEMDYLINLCKILRELEVSRIRYADTVGILTPTSARIAVSKLVEESGIEVEIHAHNDFGMAVAISIEGVKSGAKYVDCTIDGIGERAGNCNLQQFIEATEEFFPNVERLTFKAQSKK